jgi:hypothetical protein
MKRRTHCHGVGLKLLTSTLALAVMAGGQSRAQAQESQAKTSVTDYHDFGSIAPARHFGHNVWKTPAARRAWAQGAEATAPRRVRKEKRR